MARSGGAPDEVRDGVPLTSLDAELFDGAGATKRDLVDYVDAMADRLLPVLRGRPLTVVRARPGQRPFVQKNAPAAAPDWLRTREVWSGASQRVVRYVLAEDRRTLLWLAGQRAVELHPSVLDADGRADALVLDLDPPAGAPFAAVVAVARLVRQALGEVGLEAAVKTSGAKGLHLLVPLLPVGPEEAALAQRALAERAARLDPAVATTAFLVADREGRVFVDSTRAGGATLACAWSPRARPGVPVSTPVAWDDLGDVAPSDLTLATVPGLVGSGDPWQELLPPPQALPAVLVEEGRALPVPRAAAMHEGKRRAKARRDAAAHDG